MPTTKQRKLPTIRRQYHSIVGLDSGLDYSSPSTMIAETYCPACEEVTFRDKVVAKAYGTEVFAGTSTTPLSGTVMFAKQYIKNNESEKFLVHTNTNVYLYNTTTDLLECITRGEVVENCDDIWAVNANVTTILDTHLTGTIASIADYSGTVDGTVLITDVAHGLSTGHSITITASTTYDGTYTITWVSADTFYITHAWGATSTGSWTTGYPYRKGSGSVKLMIAGAFGDGAVAAYEDFTSDDFTAQTHLHFYIKSSISTAAGDLHLILGDTTGGGTPVGGSVSGRFVIPALVAGVWKEVSIAITTPANLATVESVALYVNVDNGAQVVNIDDVMVTTQLTGDEDNNIVATVVNDYYIFNNGIAPLLYYLMDDAVCTEVADGALTLSCRAMQMIGERLCLYRIGDYPRRVQWTEVGGLSTPPVATDWTDPGSGDTDLDSIFGEDVIQTAHKLGNYVVVYGKKTIAMQEYTGKTPDDPYAFYVRVAGTGTPSERGVANLGDRHIFLGWDDVYIYKGGTGVQSIGDKVSRELFDLINPTYIHRSFVVYLDEQYEVRIYFPLIGSTTPNCYFTYSLSNGSWSRGSRSYTGFGTYKRITGADTWDTIGTPTTTWDELIIRWDDVALEELAPLNIYGNSGGIVYKDNESVLNLAGVAIDGYWDTKDFVVGDGYRRRTTNWMSFGFEATGNTVKVYYSTDLGESWSEGTTFTLDSYWKQYRLDLNVNAPQIRFRFRNAILSETFEVRELELGYIEGSDRGVA